MRSTLTIALLAIGHPLVCGPAAAQPSSKSTCGHTVRGQVIDADLDTPLADAVVVIDGRADIARTGKDGRFSADGVCPGQRPLTISKAGFTSSQQDITVPQTKPAEVRLRFAMQSVTITAPQDAPNYDFGFADSLDGDNLAQTRGLSLADVLSEANGVQVLRSGAVTKPVIDGFYGNRIIILNDGLRHHAQLWALDHAPEIDPFSANRITVVRGADGVRYGADAIGGVIILEPPPFIEPNEPGMAGEVNVIGVSNGRQGIANLRLESTLWGAPRWSVRAQGSVRKTGSYSAPDYDLDNTGSEDFSGAASLRYQGRSWNAWVGASHLSTEYGVFTGIRSESIRDFEDAIQRSEPVNVELYRFSYGIDRAFSRVDHTYARADLDVDVSSWGNLHLRYGFQRNDRREFEIVRRATTGAQLTFDLVSHSLELTFDHQLGGGFSGLAGVSGLLQNNDHEGRRLIPDYERRVGGLFLIERYATDGLEIAAGVRYERQGLDTEQPTRVAPNQNPPERFSLDFEAVMATVGVTLEPHPQWQFDLHLATAIRIPTVDELFLEGLLPGEVFFVQGDRNLSPERTFNVGVGISFFHEWIDAEVTAYLHRFEDYIYRAPALDEDGNPRFRLLIIGRHPELEYRNVDALYAGGSLELNVRPFTGLELTGKATYVRARDLTNDAFLINIPPDRYEFRATYSPPEWGPLSSSDLWIESATVLRQGEFDPNADFDDPPGAYHLLNAGIGTTISVYGQAIRASLDLQNLLNAAYRDYLSRLRLFADEPGFSAILRLSVPIGLKFNQ